MWVIFPLGPPPLPFLVHSLTRPEKAAKSVSPLTEGTAPLQPFRLRPRTRTRTRMAQPSTLQGQVEALQRFAGGKVRALGSKPAPLTRGSW